MTSRRRKYSGDRDPYTNFTAAARIMGKVPDEVFPLYIAIKLARMEVSTGDFPDESELDTLRDLGNYSFLWLGWKLKKKETK